MIEWSAEQKKIIDANPNMRIVVNAGPGTGKTAVACGRVANLVDSYGLEPSNIMLISFTRTAVAEIRDRIASFLTDKYKAYSVRIATLDSFAWTLHSGFRENIPMLSYNENIKSVITLIKKDEDAQNYIRTIEHLIVDEAQDIVGIRSELVMAIVEKLAKDCGVTVFSDEAQSIYGFSNDEETRSQNESGKTLIDSIRSDYGTKFNYMNLTGIHRVKSENLKYIFKETREKVLKVSQSLQNLEWKDIHKEIKEHADQTTKEAVNQIENLPENAFILYRRRSEVLLASSFLGLRPHRIRMSGLPVCIAPWLGACFSEYTEPKIRKTDFLELWDGNVTQNLSESLNVEEAWRMLSDIAGEQGNRVNMKLLRKRLGAKQPPAEFCLPGPGKGGPIVGTIHASKGREAEHVYLMAPTGVGNNRDDQGEEIKVLFVGATRAKKYLCVGKGYFQKVHYLPQTRRICRIFGKDQASVEIGREGDIDAVSMAGREIHFEKEAKKIQENLKKMGNGFIEANAVSIPPKYDYQIKDSQGNHLGCLNKTVNSDFFEVCDLLKSEFGGWGKKPPREIRHLTVMGIRSIILSPDSRKIPEIWEPWSSSGFLLAPIILGYSKCFFREAIHDRYGKGKNPGKAERRSDRTS